MKNIVEIQNNAFNSAVKKLQVPNMEKVDVIIIRQPHGKRFYLVVSFKTHMHAHTHTNPWRQLLCLPSTLDFKEKFQAI